MKKSLLSVLLVLTLVFSLAACGNEGDVKEQDSGGESVAVEETASGGNQEDTVQAEKIEKYDSLITMTSVRTNPDGATTVNLDGDDAENNAWTRMLEEKYNIDIEYLWLAGDDTAYEEKVNLMLSSGDIPDFFRVNSQQFTELREAELIQSVGDVWELYANENAKNLIETEGGENVMKACIYDGEMMAIPFTGNPKEGAPIVYIRQDWLDNLGLDAPETMNDLIAIAEAFASQDPDQDGKDDTYAIGMDSTLFSQVSGFFYANGSWPNSYVMNENGELTDSITADGTKETLQLLHEWYEKGYIDPEWFTKDAAKSYELVSNGQIGIFIGSFSTALYPLQAQHTLEPDSDWMVMALPDYDGNLVKAPYSLGVSKYWVVSKECEHPEAVVMMLNEWVDLFYYNTDDEAQLEYINSESGTELWKNAPVQAYRGLKNMQCGLDITDYYNGNMKLEELTAEERNYVASIEGYKAGDASLWAWDKIFGVDGSATYIQDYVESDSYIYNEFWGSSTEAMKNKGSIISDYALETFTSLINGEESFDNWDSFVEKYKSLGYDEIISEVTEWYQSMQ